MAKVTREKEPVLIVRQFPAWTTILASPLLYAMIVPLIVFDICLEMLHRLAFPILGIPIVRRGSYIKLDRQQLSYLSVSLKVGCAYCGYANGLIHYALRIAGDTEAYFCPIKHQPSSDFHAPPHHEGFVEYGDAEGFGKRWSDRRRSSDRT